MDVQALHEARPMTFGMRRFCHRSRVAFAGAMAACSLVAGAADLPPIMDPPTGEYLRGKLVWIDLVTADLAGARRFYGALFGWTFAQPGGRADTYTLAYDDGVPIAGMAQRTPQPAQKRQARWIAYMSVADVAAAANSVVAHGGRLLVPPRQVPARGEMAVLADPDGALFGLINSSSGDPPDFLAAEGDWIWALYQSPDAASAAAFYQDLGGYEVVPRGRLGQAPHFLFVAGGYARASVAEIPAERIGLRPEWLYFVRVKNVAESLARVRDLGGRILVEPRADVLDGRLAVITDPSGAPLGIMEWTEADGEGQ